MYRNQTSNSLFSVGSGGTASVVVQTAILVLVCVLVTWPVILSGNMQGRAAYDSLNYHEKTIRTFAQELPEPNVSDYLSATTPGYHLLMGGLLRVIGGADVAGGYDTPLSVPPGAQGQAMDRIAWQRAALSLAGSVFAMGMVVVLVWSRRRSEGIEQENSAWGLVGVVTVLPLVVSAYVWQSAVWLLPDNAAWLMVLVIVWLASKGRMSALRCVGMGGVLCALVLTRQIHLWCAGVIWASAWLSATLPTRDSATDGLLAWRDVLPAKNSGGWLRLIVRLGVGVIVTVPACLILLAFARGFANAGASGYGFEGTLLLVPPTFLGWHGPGEIQLAAPAFFLTLVGGISMFFAGQMVGGAKIAWRQHRFALIVAAIIGLCVGVVGPSDSSVEGGRYGGLWTLLAHVPTIGQRSIVIVVGSIVGSVAMMIWLAMLPRRMRWILLASAAGFAIAQCANKQLWQRYHEPFALMWVMFAALNTPGFVSTMGASIWKNTVERWLFTWRVVGPLMLACVLGAWTVADWAGKPVETDKGWRLGNVETPPGMERLNAPGPSGR